MSPHQPESQGLCLPHQTGGLLRARPAMWTCGAPGDHLCTWTWYRHRWGLSICISKGRVRPAACEANRRGCLLGRWAAGPSLAPNKAQGEANGCLGLSLLGLRSWDEQAGTESPPSPSLAGMLVTLHVADSFGEAHCSETHEAVGGWGGSEKHVCVGWRRPEGTG